MALESVEIYIMSPSPARQEWLQRALGSEPTIHVPAIASTFPLLRSLISEAAVDLAVIDPGSRIESNTVRDWLIELTDLVPVLLFSAEPDPASFNFLVSSKAGGMLSADASSEQIVHAIKSIASGLTVFDGALITRDTVENPAVEPLTPRETEVLTLLADGLGNKEIAHRLNISEHTIKFHIRSILGKLGASSRTEAVSLGLRSGLIEL
jgi:Response regulator containing a CheY-like receiver domain and an HTH DNA-binding domain